MNFKDLKALKNKFRKMYELNHEVIEFSINQDDKLIEARAKEIENLISEADAILINEVVNNNYY